MNRPDRDAVRVPAIRTHRSLARRLGRLLLWLLVLVLLVRGVAGVLAPRRPAAIVQAAPRAAVTWPDDEARAFAADFARAYLSTSPRDPDGYASRLAAFAGPDLASAIAPDVGRRGPAQSVTVATVARTASLDASHALVTVAATVSGGRSPGTRYLTVPVARDPRGGLVVFDLPSLAAPPRRAVLETAPDQPLSGGEQGQIEDVLSRFFRAYLAGDARELAYFVPAGVRIGALGQRHRLVELVSVSQTAASGRRREVLATVRARDAESGVVFPLRYRLQLVHNDRWLVAAVNNGTRKGG